MAKYNVEFSCGHTEMVELFGKEADRQRKIAWLEKEGLCPDCFKAKKAAEHKAENDAAKAEAEKEGLPELTGSPKQVAWAITLRQQVLDDIAGILAKTPVQSQKMALDFKAWAVGQTESRFWIDHRNLLLRSLIGEWFGTLSDNEKAAYKAAYKK